MIDRVSTASFYRTTIDTFNTLQSENARLSRQITSGRQADTFTELGSNIQQVISLESSLKTTERFISGNQGAVSRLEIMDIALSDIQQIATEFQSQLLLERSSSAPIQNLEEFARNALDQVADRLNTRFAGRSLFAGGKTDQDAVSRTQIQNSNMFGEVATSSYYTGDNLKFSIQANQQLNLEYGITANEEPFRDLIGALHLAISGEQGSSDTILEQSGTLLEDALSGLGATRSRVNSDRIILETVNGQQERIKLQLQDIVNETVAADLAEASIEQALNEAQLTATFQTFGRISQLTLVDFLR